MRAGGSGRPLSWHWRGGPPSATPELGVRVGVRVGLGSVFAWCSVRPAGALSDVPLLAPRREYENLKEARKASGELADKLKKDLFSSRSKVPAGAGGGRVSCGGKGGWRGAVLLPRSGPAPEQGPGPVGPLTQGCGLTRRQSLVLTGWAQAVCLVQLGWRGTQVLCWRAALCPLLPRLLPSAGRRAGPKCAALRGPRQARSTCAGNPVGSARPLGSRAWRIPGRGAQGSLKGLAGPQPRPWS